MADELRGKKIAALVDHGFEQSELLEPKKALEQAGAEVDVVSPQTGKSRAGSTPNGATKVRSIERSRPRARRTTTRCCCPAG